MRAESGGDEEEEEAQADADDGQEAPKYFGDSGAGGAGGGEGPAVAGADPDQQPAWAAAGEQAERTAVALAKFKEASGQVQSGVAAAAALRAAGLDPEAAGQQPGTQLFGRDDEAEVAQQACPRRILPLPLPHSPSALAAFSPCPPPRPCMAAPGCGI